MLFTRKDPEPKFVQSSYNTFLKKLPGSYSDYRWRRDAAMRSHFQQTLRSLDFVVARLNLSKVNSHILEVGGGDGMWVEQIWGPRVGAIDFLDISEEMLEQAKARLASCGHISYIHSDFLAWTAPVDKYDVVSIIRNLEYMEDKHAALIKTKQVLKPGGTLVLITKNPESDFLGYYKKHKLHAGRISIKELRALLISAGFSDVYIYPAIIGKKLQYSFSRFIWQGIQWVLLRAPKLVSLPWFSRIFAESFLITARKP